MSSLRWTHVSEEWQQAINKSRASKWVRLPSIKIKKMTVIFISWKCFMQVKFTQLLQYGRAKLTKLIQNSTADALYGELSMSSVMMNNWFFSIWFALINLCYTQMCVDMHCLRSNYFEPVSTSFHRAVVHELTLRMTFHLPCLVAKIWQVSVTEQLSAITVQVTVLCSY